MSKPHSHQSQNTPDQPATSSQQAKSRLHQLIEGSSESNNDPAASQAADPAADSAPEPILEPVLESPSEPTQAIASSRLKSLFSKSRPAGAEPEVTTSKAKRKSKAKSAKPKHSIKVKLKDDSDTTAQSDAAPVDATANSATEAVAEPKVYPVVVYTPQELEQAHKNGAERIVVRGPLAKKLSTALKCLRSVGAPSYNTLALVLSGAALLSPFTGGVTVMGTLGAAVTAAAIAALSAIGLSLVIAVLKGYDEVKLGGGGVELVIKKKKEQDSEPATGAAGAASAEGANPIANSSSDLKN